MQMQKGTHLARCLVQAQLVPELFLRDGIVVVDLVAEDEERHLRQALNGDCPSVTSYFHLVSGMQSSPDRYGLPILIHTSLTCHLEVEKRGEKRHTQRVQLRLALGEPLPVRRVYQKHNPVHFGEIVPPQPARLHVTAEIICGELDVADGQLLGSCMSALSLPLH